MTGYEIGHRGKRKRKREEDDGKSLVAVVKEENCGSAVDDESVDENVSDVEDDGHFPHLLHLRHPRLTHEKESLDRFRQEGFKIRTGKFSERETERVHSNMSDIMNSLPASQFWTTKEEYDDVRMTLLGLFAQVETKSGLRKRHILGKMNPNDPLSCPHRAFYFKLGRGLPRRTLISIKQKLCNQIPFRERGSLTDEEIHVILEQRRQQVGHIQIAYDNTVIPLHVRDVVGSKLTPTLEYKTESSFTLNEDAKLIRHVKRQLSLDKIEDHNRGMKVKWTDIAFQLNGRTRQDCYHRFHDNLIPLFGTEEMALMQRKKKHIKKDMAKILFFVNREESQYELAIDWAALRSKIPHLPMHAAMRLFHDLMSKVPKDEYFNFRESIEWLVENELPKLTKGKEEKLKELEEFYAASYCF